MDILRALSSGFVYLFMCFLFFRIFRMVLDLLDPIAEDADSVPVVPRLNHTVQRLFNRIIMRVVTVIVRHTAYEERIARLSKENKDAEDSSDDGTVSKSHVFAVFLPIMLFSSQIMSQSDYQI